MANEVLWVDDSYWFKGTKAPADGALLALEIARGWRNGSQLHDEDHRYADRYAEAVSRNAYVNDDLMQKYGLPNGQQKQTIESANEFFEAIYTLVCQLNQVGAFRNSPLVTELNLPTMESRHPEVDICRAVNASYSKDQALPELEFRDNKFAQKIIPFRSMEAQAYSGIAEIAASNGDDTYSICQFRKCNKFFRGQTKRSLFCCASHRTMAQREQSKGK